MDQLNFEKLHNDLKLSHHPFKRSYKYLKWAFNGIDFRNKTVLDVGGGNGIYSYYAKHMGASRCLNLEPFADGSDNIKVVGKSEIEELEIDTLPQTFQEFNPKFEFDIIILHDSINHLDEENFSYIHNDEKAYKVYVDIVAKIHSMLSTDGHVVVADCSRINFFNSIGLRNPFAPSIEWELHQHPPLLIKLFAANNLELVSLRWSPFKRFGSFGRLLSKLGFPISYFMQSHFNMVFVKREKSV